jgi:hypothetical protein
MPVGLKQRKFSDLSASCLKKQKMCHVQPVPVGNFPNPWLAEWRSQVVQALREGEEGGGGGGGGMPDCSDQVSKLKDQIEELEDRLKRRNDKQPAPSSNPSNPSSSSENAEAERQTAQLIKEVDSKKEFEQKTKDELVNMLMNVRKYIPMEENPDKHLKEFQTALVDYAKALNANVPPKQERELMIELSLKMAALSDDDYKMANFLLNNLGQLSANDTEVEAFLKVDAVKPNIRIFEGISKEDLKEFDNNKVRNKLLEPVMAKQEPLENKNGAESRIKEIRLALGLDRDEDAIKKVADLNNKNVEKSKAEAKERARSKAVFSQWIDTWKRLFKLSKITPRSKAYQLKEDAKKLDAALGEVVQRWIINAQTNPNYFSVLVATDDELKNLGQEWFGPRASLPNKWEKEELSGLAYRLELAAENTITNGKAYSVKIREFITVKRGESVFNAPYTLTGKQELLNQLFQKYEVDSGSGSGSGANTAPPPPPVAPPVAPPPKAPPPPPPRAPPDVTPATPSSSSSVPRGDMLAILTAGLGSVKLRRATTRESKPMGGRVVDSGSGSGSGANTAPPPPPVAPPVAPPPRAPPPPPPRAPPVVTPVTPSSSSSVPRGDMLAILTAGLGSVKLRRATTRESKPMGGRVVEDTNISLANMKLVTVADYSWMPGIKKSLGVR